MVVYVPAVPGYSRADRVDTLVTASGNVIAEAVQCGKIVSILDGSRSRGFG